MQNGTVARSLSRVIRTDARHLSALSSLSFGALRKAQRTLDRTRGDSDAGSDGSYSTEDQDDSSDEESKQEDESGVTKHPKRVTALATGHKSKHA
jgi:hypothetical protein